VPGADITELLRAWTGGDKQSLDELTPLVYDHMRRMAEKIFRGERSDHTLQPTALVNEAFSQMIHAEVDWQDRSHFFALAARLMRRILVDHARSRFAAKRGGEALHVPLDDNAVVWSEAGGEVLDLHDAIGRLAEADERKAGILELHYFGGLTFEEMSEVVGASVSTVKRELRFAKAWLKVNMQPAGEPRGQ
jgi:RNA polymerase sigma factor (TIGR02999 family)